MSQEHPPKALTQPQPPKPGPDTRWVEPPRLVRDPLWRIAWRWLCGKTLSPAFWTPAFDHPPPTKSRGHLIHVWLACLACFFLPWPRPFIEWAAMPVIVWTVVRMIEYRGVFWRPALFPAVILFVLFGAWQATTLLWSPDVPEGGQEFVKLRWLALIFCVWPVLDRRGWLIASLAAGLLCGNLAQLSTALGRAWDVPWMVYPLTGSNFLWGGDPDRNGGWYHPLIAGSMFLAALALHLPAAAMGAGRERWLGVAGTLVSLVGVLATGTRSAIAGAACLIALVLAIAAWRAMRSRGPRAWRGLAAAGVVAVVGAGVGWALVGDNLQRRFERAGAELSAAVEQGKFNSDAGARVGMLLASRDAVLERPLGGVGAGGFADWYRRWLERRGTPPEPGFDFGHAHNALAHIAATTGLIGAVLASLAALAALAGAFASLPAGGIASYAAGPALAILALLLVSPIDPVNINQQTGALLMLLIGLCAPAGPHTSRSRERL